MQLRSADGPTLTTSLCRSGISARKGKITKTAILEQALFIASHEGLEALSFGELAEQMRMSKTGVYAKFGSLQTLQLEVVKLYSSHFEKTVSTPGHACPVGLPRLKSMFMHWTLQVSAKTTAGCFYISCASEYDDRPGLVRDLLIRHILAWREALETCVCEALNLRHINSSMDAKQIVHEIFGYILVLHHDMRLLGDQDCVKRTQLAFDRLIDRLQIVGSNQ